ncbi:MAG: insulinase family protein [Prevotella sp.]|jgi:predicted Zn-dependent peptidase|nr:insulinase family protein [Prevotella sp.]
MTNPNYFLHTLPNGLRLAHIQLPTNVSYCGLIINAGTRDEAYGEYGMAHFIEHLLFKGTEKRRSHHIINRMEAVGGELNAYTNKEETVIYSIFLEQCLERAVELLSDLAFHSQFPQHEINREIDVILDEINSYEDSPSELIFDEFENLVFRGSQLGHNILGEADLLKSFNTDMAKRFAAAHYRPSEMVFFSAGKTDFRKVVRLGEKYLAVPERSGSHLRRILPPEISPVSQQENKDTAQAHVMLGSRSYNLHDPRRRILHLLNNLLGGPGMNSRLNISLREKTGYVYNVESSLTNYSDVGLFSIYFGTDKQQVEKCIRLAQKELDKLRNRKMSPSQLYAAKKQLCGQIAIAGDQHENLALTFGKSIMRYNRFDSMDETFRKIEAITAEDLLAVANEIFDEQRLFMLTYE